MRVVAVQFDIAWETKPDNFQAVRRLLAAAPPERGSLVVLPEMFATGFSMNGEAIAENPGGPTEQFLAATAQEWGVHLIGGAAMRGRDGRLRNKALVFSPEGKLAAYYAKRRPFTPGGEHQHYTAGKRAAAFRWGEVTVSPLICYDLRFPELFREAAATFRPELFAVIASFPAKRASHWIRLLQARAIENQAYVVGVNRVGTDPFYAYNGHSVIVDPHGDILADAGESEGCVSAALDLDMLRQYRKGLPFLEELKPNRPATERTD